MPEAMAKKVNKDVVVIFGCSLLIVVARGSLIAIRLNIYGRLRRTRNVNAVFDEYPNKNRMPKPTVPDSPWIMDSVILFIYLFTQNEINEVPGKPAFAKTYQLIPGRLDFFVG